MSNTTTQFKIMSNEFQAKYPSELSADEELCRMIETARGIPDCFYCGSKNTTRQFKSRKILCKNCHRWFHITKGTIFERMKKPRTWLAALIFIGEGIELNSADLSILGNTSISSCWTILKKISIVIDNALITSTLNSKINCDSGEFIDIFMRRSTETPAKLHPRDEEFAKQQESWTKKQKESKPIDIQNSACFQINQNENEREKAIAIQEINNELLDSLEPIEAKLYSRLTDIPLHFDELTAGTNARETISTAEALSGLTMLELKGLICRKAGEFYCRTICIGNIASKGGIHSDSTTQERRHKDEVICDFKNSIMKIFRGISRKYLQLSLSFLWCLRNREIWNIEYLFKNCCKSPPISYSWINSYSTKLYIEIGSNKSYSS